MHSPTQKMVAVLSLMFMSLTVFAADDVKIKYTTLIQMRDYGSSRVVSVVNFPQVFTADEASARALVPSYQAKKLVCEKLKLGQPINYGSTDLSLSDLLRGQLVQIDQEGRLSDARSDGKSLAVVTCETESLN